MPPLLSRRLQILGGSEDEHSVKSRPKVSSEVPPISSDKMRCANPDGTRENRKVLLRESGLPHLGEVLRLYGHPRARRC
jgi:hypothetical protein